MELKEFVEGCLRTESKPDGQMATRVLDSLRGLHAVMGMCTEAGELLECVGKKEIDFVNVKEELGDLLWYVALFFDAVIEGDVAYQSCCRVLSDPHGIPVGYLIEKGVSHLATVSADLLDQFKKWIFYGKSLQAERLIGSVLVVCGIMRDITESLGIGISEIQQKVLDKLRARSPDKFTSENAINRDLAVERAVLEGNSDEYVHVVPLFQWVDSD